MYINYPFISNEQVGVLILSFFTYKVLVEPYMKKRRNNFVDIIVLEDTAHPRPAHLTANDIIDRYGYAKDLEQRATFRYSTISRCYKTEAIEATISDGHDSVARNTENRIDFRFKEIESFHESVASIISGQQEVNEPQVLLPQSGVFKTIIEEFNVFDRATEKVLLISSGLFECSSVFNSQSPADVALLHSSPKSIARRIRKTYKISKVDKVQMDLIYEPTDKADWERFLKMAVVVSLVFTPKGARVSIKTSSKVNSL